MSATAALATGLFFLRFWRQTGHRVFVYFGAAFWLMALSWSLLALVNPDDETRPLIYSIRLVAYVLLIVGMLVRGTITEQPPE